MKIDTKKANTPLPITLLILPSHRPAVQMKNPAPSHPMPSVAEDLGGGRGACVRSSVTPPPGRARKKADHLRPAYQITTRSAWLGGARMWLDTYEAGRWFPIGAEIG